jgi:hypothetical protein
VVLLVPPEKLMGSMTICFLEELMGLQRFNIF